MAEIDYPEIAYPEIDYPEINYPLMPPPLILRRTLSYTNDQYDHALTYTNDCEEGDTVLMNYYMDQEEWVIGHYLQMIDGKMVEQEFEEPLEHVRMDWTFDVCPFPIQTLYDD